MAYTLTWNDYGTYVKFQGPLSADEVEEANFRHYGNDRFKEIEYQIFDFLDADVSQVVIEDARDAAKLDNTVSFSKPNFKVALIGTGQHMESLFNEYIQLLNGTESSWDVRVFDNSDDAIRWCHPLP